MKSDASDATVHSDGSPIQRGLIPACAEKGMDFKLAHVAYTFIEELEWWSRVWVIQELAMAKEVIVRCGHK
jgi:hypothetical protein